MGINTSAAGKFLRDRIGLRYGKRIGLAAFALAAPVVMTASANAALVYSITNLTDGPSASNVASGTVGGVTFSDFTAGSDSPGDGTYALVKLTSINLTNTTSGTETVSLLVSDTGFTSPGGPGSTLQIVGTDSGTPETPGTSGTASMTAYADNTNSANPTASPTVTTSTGTDSFYFIGPPLPPAGFTDSTAFAPFSRSAIAPAYYSLAGVITVTLSAGGEVQLTNDTVTFSTMVVPEPTSLAMIGIGSLFLVRRRRMGK